ncbi:hypothetical protein GCM10023262_15610 [Bartonella pachyuromydis]|uniref:Uncharacterized protein n=1 Tax=Bartonella pachyuromydis TaxID=931097 RepID=A0ABP8VNX7_9HYPH
MKNYIAIHLGKILREEYLKEYALSAYALAKALNVLRTRIERIVAEDSPITPDTALRLASFLIRQLSSGLTCKQLMMFIFCKQKKQTNLPKLINSGTQPNLQ